MEEAKKKVDLSIHLRRIWDLINNSLQNIGLKFTNFDQFQSSYEVQESFFYKILNIFKD